MNLDPRSASTNTEFGMFIESPALAKELLRVINISKLESAYRLRLDPETGALQWLTRRGRQGSHSRRRARVELLAARAQHAARLVRPGAAPVAVAFRTAPRRRHNRLDAHSVAQPSARSRRDFGGRECDEVFEDGHAGVRR